LLVRMLSSSARRSGCGDPTIASFRDSRRLTSSACGNRALFVRLHGAQATTRFHTPFRSGPAHDPVFISAKG
jgi:hypothetical protein